MNFDFPDEIKQLGGIAREFLTDRCPPATCRAILEGEAPFDGALWKEIAELGWLSAAIPEEFGGLGMGYLAVCVIAEELGRAIAPIPYASSVYLATEAIIIYGSQQQKVGLLPKLASGASHATLAWAENTGPINISSLETRVANGRLSGTKAVVMDGMSADFAVVATVDQDDQPLLYIADLKNAGVTRKVAPTIDPSRSHARIIFDDVPVEPLPGARGNAALQRLLDRAAVMMAFEQIGTANAALDMACDYAKGRYAFGRPIGSFQAIKHKLVDVYVALELARSNCFFGAWALSNDASELSVAAAASRVSACKAGWLATKENIQTHGGMGFTWELDCHLLYRRAKLQALTLGSAREWKRNLITGIRTQHDVNQMPKAA